MWRWKTAQVLRNRIFRATRNNHRWPSHRRRPPTARLATTTFIRTVLCHRKVQLVASYISFETLPIRDFNSFEGKILSIREILKIYHFLYIRTYIRFLLFAEVDNANAATAAQLVGLVQVLAAGEQAVAAVVARANDSSKRDGRGGRKYSHVK